MRKLPAFAFAGIAAVMLAGAALAATSDRHIMNVSLPDGSVAHVEYVGNVAPKVTVDSRSLSAFGWAPMAFPSFAGFDRMIEQMNRETDAMMRQAQQIAHQSPGAPTSYVASYGDMPAGVTSTTVVSTSTNGRTCTRMTHSVSEGPGKAPRVTSSVSGDCGSTSEAPQTRINRT